MKTTCLLAALALALAACSTKPKEASTQTVSSPGTGSKDSSGLPPQSESHTRFANCIGWPEGKMPAAPGGFAVTKYMGEELNNPRWLYQLPNGDVLVAEASTDAGLVKKAKDLVSGKGKADNKNNVASGSANRITLMRDADNDGKPEMHTVFLDGLNQPFGMLVLAGKFYVANTDGVWMYPYTEGQTEDDRRGPQDIGAAR